MAVIRWSSVAGLVILTRVAIAAALAEPPPGDLEKIRLAAPQDAPAKPNNPRSVLVFSGADGFVHDSIPWGEAALRIMGEKTGAYSATLSDDPAFFDRERLFQFDAVVMNNNCGNPIADIQRRTNLLEFVRSGRGLVGIHCAAHLDWPEYTEMLGGYSISHPWNAGSTVMIRLEEPDHPLLRSFTTASFAHSDEIFVFRDFSRQKVRVLLSLDTAHTDMNKPGVTKDQDVPLAWIRRYGEGRVFYSALGHQKDVYWRSSILKHYLSGIQFALGDLKADATPSSPAGNKHRQIQVTVVDGITVVSFVQSKILSEPDVQTLGEELFGLVDRDGCKFLVLDFQKVQFCSSAVIGKLVTGPRIRQRIGGTWKCTNRIRTITATTTTTCSAIVPRRPWR
jgi:type 1 glutamine amidotransferase